MFDQFGTDQNLEKDGVWLDFEEFRIKLAHEGGGNTAFQREIEREAKPVRRMIQTGTLPTKKSEEIYMRVYARVIVKDWNILLIERDLDKKPILDENGDIQPILDENGERQWHRGIHAEDGTWIEFNEQNVYETLRKLPALFEMCKEVSSNFANFREREMERAAGN
jgi:hypothetical protein